jgi:hypothetical protein
MPRFYRLVLTDPPTEVDFKSARELGKPLRFEAHRREWSGALSVYDAHDVAEARTRQFGLRLGRYVAELAVPDDGTIEIRQTMSDPHRFSLYATGDAARALVTTVVPVQEVGSHE